MSICFIIFGIFFAYMGLRICCNKINFLKKAVTIQEDETVPGRYFFCADLETGEAAIFDVIDDNIERMKEAIERAQLLATKTKELKAIFEDENVKIEKLRTVRFCFDDDAPEEIIVPKSNKEEKKK